MRYVNTISTTGPSINGTWVDYGTASSAADTKNCSINATSGEILVSGSLMSLQQSCGPHTYNAGNYYNFPAASASTSEPASSSICPLGWKLPESDDKTSYSNLFQTYDIDFNSMNMISPYDASLLNLPLSFLRSGRYYNTGALYGQGSYGVYRVSSLNLYFGSSSLVPTSSTSANDGYSVRCVSR